MKKSSSILTVIILIFNTLLNPISTITSVYAQEDASVASSVVTEAPVVQEEVAPPVIEEVPEPVVPEVVPDIPTEPEIEVPVESETIPESIPESSVEESTESEESSESEESEESEDESDPVTTIGFEGVVNSNIRTGSTIHVPVRITNTDAALEGAILRYTVSGEHVAPYDSVSSYFPGAGGAVNAYNNGGNFIVEYSLNTLSEEYNQLVTLALKTKDDGSMKNGSSLSVNAEVIQNGNSVAQSGNVNYSFVTRQPQFSTHVTYPSESTSSEEDDEGPARQTEIAYSLSFGGEGGGDGLGQSAVTNLTVTTTVPESLSFDAAMNEGWSYNEGTRTATYSVVPPSSIYNEGYQLPVTLTLQTNDSREDVQEAIYAEAVFEFENGDVVTRTNQPEIMMAALEITPMAAVQENLVTDFEMIIYDNNNGQTVVNNGDVLDLNINDLNALQLTYGLVKPNELDIAAGDTYTISLPAIFDGSTTNQPISFNGVTLATYDIVNGQLVITFNEEVNAFDNVEMNVNVTGAFNTQVFEEQEEVIVEVPYREGSSFTATLRPEQQEFEGQDRKSAGTPYILADGNKTEVTRNPTHIDWTVVANDSAGSFANATVVDDLGPNLELVPDSFSVQRIIRNYNNDELRRETVTDFSVESTSSGFELGLGSIEDAYIISYTTRVIRPDGGGNHQINNNARIILDGSETTVTDGFEGVWSGDLPAITKTGNLVEDRRDLIEWQVEYNYGQEALGEVTLSDVLSHGEIVPDSVQVHEVVPNEDGVVSDFGSPTSGSFPLTLDADGRAYYITYQTSVPVGLNNTVINTVSDNLTPQNSDDASVTVNTIPTGGKVGEQYVDENGNPYIEWTITMNTEKVDVPSINVLDVFDSTYLEFDPTNTSLYRMTRDGQSADNFTIIPYTHEDGRTGFELNVTDAGPHTYEFIYHTYYTIEGMKQPQLANNAELVFRDGEGEGIGETHTATVTQTGPNAGITKTGQYVYAAENPTEAPQIQWEIAFNQSRILLVNPTITDVFSSGNYSYVQDSIEVLANGQPISNYEFNTTANGFELVINEQSNALYTVRYLTNVDMDANADQSNEATLTWQGGTEDAAHTVGQRHPGIYKRANVRINDDGTKSIDWLVGFNAENRQVLHGVSVHDKYSPATATISDIKVFRDGVEIAPVSIDTSTSGEFTVELGNLDPVGYSITYTTTLSPSEETSAIRNLATISYTGGEQQAAWTVPSPTLGVSKEATNLNKTPEYPVISWRINANTDTANHQVNLVDAVLEDTIPADQRLLADTIVVTRADGTNVTASSGIATTDNSFSINLPDGPYQYIVTFDTEILEFPSVNAQIDRYTNETTLTNTGYNPVSDTAFQDYYGGGDTGLVGKSGEQNPDTENIDWNVTVNEEGLTINNPVITDTLNEYHTYLRDTISVTSGGTALAEGSDYTLEMAEDNRSFTMTFNKSITSQVDVSYSTRLNPEIVGRRDVTNSISLSGGTDSRELNSRTHSTTASQWFYGGGGSGRTINFRMNKETRNGTSLQGVGFNLQGVAFNGSVVPVDATIVTDESGVYISGDIRAGRYILTETETPAGYQTLDGPIYFSVGYSPSGVAGEFVVTLMDASWNAISGTGNVSATGNVINVVNDYEPITATFEASKTLTGQTLSANQFEFELVTLNNEVVATAKNNAEGQVTFEAQSFNAPGIYNFKIREVDSGQNGISYDNAQFDVLVVVTQGTNGLALATTYLDGPANFTNSYDPADSSVVLEAKKLLENHPLEANEFEFELVDSNGDVIETVSNNADGQVTFSQINYSETGEFNYTIREVAGTVGGVTYDDAVYPVTVTVTDDGGGQLVAEAAYVDGPAEFTNTYKPASSSVVLEASKVLTGQVLRNEQFEFELLDNEGNTIERVSNNLEGQVIFTELKYDEVGEHSYTISEVQGEQGGVTYDATDYPVTVSVTDDGEGQLVATPTYTNGPAQFTNTYVPEQDEVVIEATKVLTGQELRDNQFMFELVDSNNAIIQRVQNNDLGQVIFDEIQYDEVGEHTYTVREVQGNQGGMTYDTTEFTVKVTVTDDGEGKLTAAIIEDTEPVIFNNAYAPTDGSAVIEATKALEGQNLAADRFQFNLLDEAGDVIQTKTNNLQGQIIFDAIDYTETGTYNYVIEEVNDGQGGITYDDSRIIVTVTVTDDGEGALQSEVTYETAAHFVNTYGVTESQAVIEASKVLNGQPLTADQFDFELVDADGNVIQTQSNNDAREVTFDALTYEEVGQHFYTIREVQGDLGGVIYSQEVYSVRVDVTDDSEGQLHTNVVYLDGPAQFTNTYESQPDGVVLEASKVLENHPLELNEFAFELVDSDGNVIETVYNNALGQVTFQELNYTEVGEHSYTIREVQGSTGGITYDTTEFPVTVSVTDDGAGQLVAEATYVDGPAEFINEYKTTPDSVVLIANKVLTGQVLRDEQFSFELVDSNNVVLETVANNVDGQVIFTELNYDEVGEHTYTIREVQGVQGGVTYDTTEYPVNISVTDNGEGNLVATATYPDGPAQFINNYETTEDSIVIEATKVLTGQALRDNHFTFELVDSNNAIMQRVQNNDLGQVIFDEIQYDEVGEHTYTVREVQGNQGGMTYDPTEFTVTVTVTDDGEGQLTAEITEDTEPVIFNNAYVPTDGSAVIEATKALEGQNLAADRFQFNLLDEAGDVIQTKANNLQGQIIFDAINYTETGTYNYVIEEVNDGQGGITYDDSQINVTVTVTDDGEGALQSEVTYETDAHFVNTYGALESQAVIEASKVLNGQPLTADQFDFELVDAEGTVIQTQSNNEAGEVTFDALSYTEAGQNFYTIREVQGDLGGVTYSQQVYSVRVDVTDDAEGQLHTNVVYLDGPAQFTNIYESQPDGVVLEASKVLENKPLEAYDFEFELVDSNGDVIETVANNAQGQVTFSELNYTETGEFTYTIREVAGNMSGVTYDATEYPVTVTVEDDGAGQLVATAVYSNGPANFTNIYNTTPDSVMLEASKALLGQDLRDEQFSFELVDGEGNVIETVYNNAQGQVIFSELNYDEVGDHAYTIREIQGVQGGVTYDTTEYPVTVSVTDNGEGELVATATYTNGPANFTNRYETTQDSVVFEASKILEGQALRDGQFTFELVNANGEIIQRVQNNQLGQIVFEEISYTEVGEFAYTVREVQGNQGGVTYDASEFTVVVTVTDDDEGQLTATAAYPDGPLVFTNTYETTSDSILIQGHKGLNGTALTADQFEFQLVDEEGNVLQTVRNNQRGQIIFDELHFDTTGEFNFTVREVQGNQAGVSYDASEFVVNVVVTDNDEGELTATATYPDGPVDFVNNYTTQAESIVLEARKVLNGQQLVEGQFQFELLDETGDVIQTVGNNATGDVYFDEIQYTESGSHTYLIREVQGTQGGMTYDNSIRTVVVRVVDNGEGQLVATANYIGGPVVFNNTYVANDASVVIEANKVLEGQNQVADQFEFELVDNEGNVIDTTTNNHLGQIIFEEMTYDELGEYRYTIREVVGSQRGMTYDPTVFEVIVEVTDDREGQYVATASYIGNASFENIYQPLATEVVFEADKLLEGRALFADEFTFELVDDDSKVVATATNNADGKVYFNALAFEEVGTYNYQIREVQGTDSNITYNDNVVDVSVEVVDDEGQLVATATYAQEASFTNTYTPHAGELVLVANKELTGREQVAGEFNFEVVDSEGAVIATGTNDTNGVVNFGSINYTEVGTHEYTIREIAGLDATLTYDETEHTVTIEVTDVEGQLVANVTSEGDLQFTNEYTAPRVSVGDYVWFDENKDGIQDPDEPGIPGVVLEIRDENGDPVIDVNGEPVGPQTTDENGNYSFDNLPIDKTYTVTISPDQPALEGYEPTTPGQGDDPGKDSSTWQATSVEMVEDGQRDATLDFGFVREIELTRITGEKIWKDNNNVDETRPESITIELISNDEVIETLEVTSDGDGNWTFAFNDLPVLESNQVYEVREIPVEGYSTTVSEIEDGFVTITNTYIDPEIPGSPGTPGQPGRPGSSSGGLGGTLPGLGERSFLLVGLIILAVGIWFLLVGKNKSKED